MSGVYLYIFRIGKYYSIPIFIIVIDILCNLLRKLKIIESIYNKLISKITYVEDENKFTDIDNLDEICNVESYFFNLIYILCTINFQFINFSGKNFDLIDCKGALNPEYFDIYRSILPVIICSFSIKIILNISVFIYDKKKYDLKFPLFSNCLKFTKFFTIYYALIEVASEMLYLGIKFSKIFEI